VAVSDQGCTSDTATRFVTVHPLPVTDFSLPAAVCMPGGLAEFKNATTVADQSALSYTWNFGDNSAVSNAKDMQLPVLILLNSMRFLPLVVQVRFQRICHPSLINLWLPLP
jgi:hypothetical protein